LNASVLHTVVGFEVDLDSSKIVRLGHFKSSSILV
jgi:hypothetical protein